MSSMGKVDDSSKGKRSVVNRNSGLAKQLHERNPVCSTTTRQFKPQIQINIVAVMIIITWLAWAS
jgi:hypothetical protein